MIIKKMKKTRAKGSAFMSDMVVVIGLPSKNPFAAAFCTARRLSKHYIAVCLTNYLIGADHHGQRQREE